MTLLGLSFGYLHFVNCSSIQLKFKLDCFPWGSSKTNTIITDNHSIFNKFIIVCWNINTVFNRLPKRGLINSDHSVSAASEPSVQILSSGPLSLDPGSSCLLVCVLSGFSSAQLDVLWWVDDTRVTSANAKVSWMRSEGGGAYSAASVWEVSAADWRSRSMFWCGTVQEGRVYRQKLCSDTDWWLRAHRFDSQTGIRDTLICTCCTV